MLPVLKDNTQPLLGHLLSSSLEPAGQKKKQIIQKNKQSFKRPFLICMLYLRSPGSWKIFLDYLYPKYDDFTLNN